MICQKKIMIFKKKNRKCNCKKTSCLNKHCHCYREQKNCSNCNCEGCKNSSEFKETNSKKRKIDQILQNSESNIQNCCDCNICSPNICPCLFNGKYCLDNCPNQSCKSNNIEPEKKSFKYNSNLESPMPQKYVNNNPLLRQGSISSRSKTESIKILNQCINENELTIFTKKVLNKIISISDNQKLEGQEIESIVLKEFVQYMRENINKIKQVSNQN